MIKNLDDLEKRLVKLKKHISNNKKDKKSLLAIQKISCKKKKILKFLSKKNRCGEIW
ncbi:hypothetical protein ACWNX6_00275 [Candidatus Vidania fulgoroideorum]